MKDLTTPDGLVAKAEEVAKRITEAFKLGGNLLFLSHYDADGLAAAGILAKACVRREINFNARITSELNNGLIEELSKEEYRLYVITDLGSGFASSLEAKLENWVVIDHHELSEDEYENSNFLNAWQFGLDGATEASSSSLAYMVSLSMDRGNKDLSSLAIVGSLGDRQDKGEQRSLLGLNKAILEDAVEAGVVKVKKDLLLHRRENLPLHTSLAFTDTLSIPGLTGNEDTCLSALVSEGFELKKGEFWRTLADFDEEERKKLLDFLISHLGASAEERMKDLIGQVYILEEDIYSPLRDAREFGTLLNACGRLGRPSLGLSILLGDRDEALREAEDVLSHYRRKLANYLQVFTESTDKVMERRNFYYVMGEGVLEPETLGTVVSMIGSTPRYIGMTIVGSTLNEGGSYKISARTVKPDIDLGRIIRTLAEKCGGYGGGHSVAAGANIPHERLEEFLGGMEAALEGSHNV